ncbi:GNAT family N-acetyltransferase [Chloroflexota bacterium]
MPLNSNAPDDIIALSVFKMSREMIEALSAKDASIVYEVINKATSAYRGIIPEDCYHEPYMPEQELLRELQRMIFFGWRDKDKIVGVMGFQKVGDVTLVRHAYVLPEYQKKGIGTNLLNHVKQITKTKRLLVGTWQDAVWAIQFYQKHGFKLMPDKDKFLRKYWDIPQRQIETSVVLGIEK